MRWFTLVLALAVACGGSDDGGTANNDLTGGTAGVAGSGGAGGGSGGSGGSGASSGAAGSAAGAAGAAASGGVGGQAGAASGGSTQTGGTAGTAGSGGTSATPPPLDLGKVTWLHTNVSGWKVTVNLDGVSVSGSQVCMDHDIAGKGWAIKTISGVEVIANPWVFIYKDAKWYGATWEWLRPPGQTCKNKTSVAGDHIKVAPFDAASGWAPKSGETLYFMVSGLARGGLTNVQERSDPVKVVWP